MLEAPKVHFIQLKSVSVENIGILDTLEPHQQLAIVDAGCTGSDKLLAEARYRIYDKIRWIVLSDENTRTADDQENAVFRLTSGLPITGSSEIYYFVKAKSDETLIKDVYRRSMMTELQSSMVGIWRNGTIEDKRSAPSVVSRRRNLQNLPIKTTLVYTNNYTLSHFDDLETTEIDTLPRVSYHILQTLFGYYLNATLEKRYASSWGYPNGSTGIWSGMCGDLIYRRSEVAGSCMLITQSRLFLVDYLKMPIPMKVQFIFKAPNLSTTRNIFRMPFDFGVWICLLGLIVITGTIFAVVRGVLIFNKKSIKSKHMELLDAAFDILAITAQQGSLIEAKSSAQRILIFVSLAGLMFFEVSFSAKIISLIQAPSERINSIPRLLESSLELGADGQPYNQFYFSELFAYQGFTSQIYRRISNTFNDVEKCYLRELQFIHSDIGYLSVQRNFTLREHFNVGLMRMLEVGVYAKQYRMMVTEKPTCTKGIMFRPLDLVDTKFAMKIAACGVAVATCVLLVEIAVGKYTLWKTPLLVYTE
ncbi:glutamate receptor ionotropic, delta-2-like [Sabethes cyaneus]|uniref:glutamate receptor ionotropic, delta-2-like n=1 Tax=Sabethes cyaneus TaxID=53552 RepID=UPI00237D9714|nr:glutamate receptor ionotropic, delta-2-like [Sabethes cyaneus]